MNEILEKISKKNLVLIDLSTDIDMSIDFIDYFLKFFELLDYSYLVLKKDNIMILNKYYFYLFFDFLKRSFLYQSENLYVPIFTKRSFNNKHYYKIYFYEVLNQKLFYSENFENKKKFTKKFNKLQNCFKTIEEEEEFIHFISELELMYKQIVKNFDYSNFLYHIDKYFFLYENTDLKESELDMYNMLYLINSNEKTLKYNKNKKFFMKKNCFFVSDKKNVIPYFEILREEKEQIFTEIQLKYSQE